MRYILTLAFLLMQVSGLFAEDFFNGKDLAGWKGLREHWSVKDGAILGSTQPKGINFNTFLCTEREYQNFELKLKVKLSPNGNSGVQIRSKLIDDKKYVVAGPQCDMGQIYWGSLYGEQFGGMMKAADAAKVKEVVKVGEFNDYYIRCVEKHVTIKINGVTFLDEDFPKLPERGIIAFQAHGGAAMDVVFKEIEFTELR
ncbi:MAG TPA: DUF1080 domain-containing protein [Gemmatales bacterium]|nr:DUF1080 domain-containing protein [Gemmatales bacterium]HMP15676.1 DUF1080 domain-containing protein [Gemmatales bacterium]